MDEPLSPRQRRFRDGLARLSGLTISSVDQMGEPGLFPQEYTGTLIVKTRGAAYWDMIHWRLVQDGHVQVKSAEHGHKYGLPASIDAVAQVTKALVGRTIQKAWVDEETGDFWVQMDSCRLQVLNLFLGYETWHVHVDEGLAEYSNYIWEE